jgi:hypothetical protein
MTDDKELPHIRTVGSSHLPCKIRDQQRTPTLRKILIHSCNCQPLLLVLHAGFHNSKALNSSARKMLRVVFILEVLRILGRLCMKQNHQPQKQDRRVYSLVFLFTTDTNKQS